MSDANRTTVAVVEETTLGTTPATPAFEALRVTSSALTYAKTSVTSKELVADRQISDLIAVGFNANGDIPQEASYGAIDTLLRGAMMSDWVYTSVRANTLATNISAVSATAYTVVASDGSKYKTGTFAVGMYIAASGFAAAGNNRNFRAAATTSGTSIVMTGGTIDASPASTARVKQIGFQGASADIVAVAGGLGTQGLTATALDFTTLGLAVGAWVYVGGAAAGNSFATAATKGFCRISSIAAGTLLFDVVPTGWAADVGTGKTILVFMGDYIRNGTTKRSFSIELQYQDLVTPEYEYYSGMVVSQFELNVQKQAVLQVKTTFMGMNAVDQTSRFTGATDVAAPTNDVMNASNNVGFVYENGAAIPGANFVMGMTMNINNNTRRNEAVGSLAAVNIGLGQALITGTLDMYYGSNTILNKIRNSTASGYCFNINDPGATSGYMFDAPKIKYSDGNPTVPGIDTDRMLNTKYQAVKHPTLGYTLHAQRFEQYNV